MAPRSPVAAPPALPPRISLINSAIPGESLADPPGSRWESGYAFQPEACRVSGVTDPCDPDAMTVTDANVPDEVEGEPFVVWAGDRCSTFGFSEQDFTGRVERQLLACESYQIAQELWKGTQAKASGWPNRYLASEASDVLTSAAEDVLDALACLEQGLAQCACGQQGMIHATRQVVTHWMANTLVRREGNLLLTAMDTIVVADAGYDGSSPLGAAAANGSIWAYATGPVVVRRGPIEYIPVGGDWRTATATSTTNVVELRAERMASATWDGCCHLAVEINLGLCGIGGAGS